MYTLICEKCGKTFKSKKKESRFCSRACYQSYCKETGCLKGFHKIELVEVVCKECGKHEFVLPSRAKKYVCCSISCLSKYNSKRYNKKVILTCPICGKEYTCKQSKLKNHKTCGDSNCRKKWLSKTRIGCNNSNYKKVEDLLKETGTRYKRTKIYRHIVKEFFRLNNTKEIPKNYDIHHKDADKNNNSLTNLVLIPREAHMLIHRYFGNILINALHTNKISRELFFSMCNEEQKAFYEQIIDLDITNQVVVKQGELLENPEVGNQQPNIYRNIYVGSETNVRVLPDNAGDSNGDTSALPVNYGEDIVQAACITYEDVEVQDKELVR